jgi:hypothetical protein
MSDRSPKLPQLIDLLEVARTGSFGRIRMSSRLSSFADEVGPPSQWGGFSVAPPLSCIMRFGEIEVGFICHANDMIVSWAKFRLHKFRKDQLKFAKDLYGHEVRITNNFGFRLPPLAVVRERVEEAGIGYSSSFTEPVLEDTAAVMDFGNSIKFYFSKRPGNPLETIWIS